jgi:hypothetical protein
MNLWVKRGVLVTPERLLGPEFLQDVGESKFRTKEDWENYKKEIYKMARFHSKVLKEIREGKKETKKFIVVPDPMKESKNGD